MASPESSETIEIGSQSASKAKCVKRSKPIQRRKTFTGCWTCRNRKIKCDLGRPACSRCLKSNIKCGGYHVKLVWNNKGDADAETESFQRRNIGQFFLFFSFLNEIVGGNVLFDPILTETLPICRFRGLSAGNDV